MEKITVVLKKGIWLYDNTHELGFSILKQNWDYYYEDGYSDDEPSLNNEGLAFYVVIYNIGELEYISRSSTFLTMEDVYSYIKDTLPKAKWIQ